MDAEKVKSIIEAALMAADEPLTKDRLIKLFKRGEVPIDELREAITAALQTLEEECETRGYELKRVASGYRYQVRQELSEWVSRLWEEKPPRYSRALMETLSLIVYRQPVTRGDIEQVRGVAVSQNILRTLLERGWVRVVGTRDVPGKPAMYGTTKAFLDYFNLKSLSELPPLEEIREMLEEPTLESDDVAQKPLPELDEHGDQVQSAEDARAAEADEAGAEEPADEVAQVPEAAAGIVDAPMEEVRIEVEVVEPGEENAAPLAEVVPLPTQSG